MMGLIWTYLKLAVYKNVWNHKINTAFQNYDMTQIVLVRKVGQSDGHSDQIPKCREASLWIINNLL